MQQRHKEWKRVWSLSGNQGNSWQSASVDLSAYVGQYLDVRFYTKVGPSFRSDAAIDDFNLEITTNNGSEGITGVVTYLRDWRYEACAPATVGEPVENIAVTLRQLDDNSTTTSITNNDGEFFFPNIREGRIDLTTNWEIAKGFGYLDVLDMVAIRRHVLEFDNFKCPVSRIAADTNFDGVIDSFDINYLSQVILGNDHIPPSRKVRLVPALSTNPTTTHPDPTFVANFWSQGYPAESEIGNEPYYPFSARLLNNGNPYTYLGSTQSKWMDHVYDWNHFDDECNTNIYNFWLLFTGDVTFDGNPDFRVPNGGVKQVSKNSQPQPNYQLKSLEMTVAMGDAKSKRRGKPGYKLKVSMQSEKPIIGYQFELKSRNDIFTVEEVVPTKSKLRQDLSENFNGMIDERNNQSVRTVWVADGGDSALQQVDISNWTTLFEMPISPVSDDITKAELISAVKLSDAFQYQFVGEEGVINKDVSLRVELIEF
ncbi:hypothetical protein [Lewinella sp. 4G2]|uniref:hypothetical protein n=1 Tax=Lewinella sp. 4G2 TaxID=1803372 RepID=UPI0007B45E48|nr:hypothetical protein [Lewinella sp. 4G2]OAV43907.1 hypothetical protein A3850_005105 [Lewinella sp. 4G2]